mgnify:CR=1 FL=1
MFPIIDEIYNKIKKDGADYEVKENLQTSAEYLSNLCLENSGKYYDFTDRDLFNACEVFSFFLIDTIWKENNEKLTKEKMRELATTAGEAIRELVKMTTDKDIHELVKNLIK